jgi:hypothetical protein
MKSKVGNCGGICIDSYIAEKGPRGLKNRAVKNLGGVLIVSGW